MGKKLYRYGKALFDSLEDAVGYARSQLDCPSPDVQARLEEIKNGTYHQHLPSQNLPSDFSLRDKMPPVYDQGTRGTCVANAATALAEYFNDNKWRFSVQFLFEMMKQRELEARNQAAAEIREGREPSDPIMAKRARAIASHLANQRRRVASIGAANSGATGGSAPAAVTAGDIAAAIMGMEIRRDGSLLHRAFEVLGTKGICTEKFWPYARTQIERNSLVDGLETSSLPPGAEDNAKKHVIAPGLFYLLRASNNIEELKRIISGFGGNRPMPVCIGVDVYGQMPVTNGIVDMPALGEVEIYEEEYEARYTDASMTRYVVGDPIPGTLSVAATVTAFCGNGGGHEIILVGYRDDQSLPGGGAFEMRNSWDETWGEGGYAWIPYAYVEMFCDEAGTIIQSMEDYVGDSYGGMNTNPSAAGGFSWGIPEELKPYIVFAATDMKNSRGKWTIAKGAKVIVDADGIAEPDNELNRKRFISQGFRWSGGAGVAAQSQNEGQGNVPPNGSSERSRFISCLEAGFKNASIAFPCLGGIRKGGLFSSVPKVIEFKGVADLSSQLGGGNTLKIYEANGKKNCFRIAAAYFLKSDGAGDRAERVRQLVEEYNASRKFNPCDCTITIVGADCDILSSVAPYASDTDVRIVIGGYSDASGWRVRLPDGVEGGSWTEWIKLLVPNSPRQWRTILENAWKDVADEGGHVTLGKMAAVCGLSQDIVTTFVADFLSGYAVKGERVVKG